MNTSVEKAVMMSIISLLRHKVFYGHILQQLSKTFVKGENAPVPTMGVGKREGDLLIKLFVNDDFVKSLFEKAVKDSGNEKQAWTWIESILEHEVIHVIFEHLTMTFADKQRGAVAQDLTVNSCISKDSLPAGAILVDDYGFPPHKSAFWYYQNLKDNKKYQQQSANGDFGAGGKLSDALDAHKAWEEAKKDPIFQEFAKDIIQKAKDLCGRDYGNVPSEVIDQIDVTLAKKPSVVPWQKVLRTFVASATESNLDYTMKRISKRFGTRPGTRKEDVLKLAVAVDTSGSVCDEMLRKFFNEIRWIWKNGADITIYEADADIAAVYKYKGKFNGNVHGRGGTDLNPVLRAVEGKYDALIYFTDFYAPPLERKFRIPTLWVLHTAMDKSQYPADWGKVIRIENDVAEAG